MAGESGSGKTTLAMLLLGFINATTGQIIYRGKNIVSLHGEERMAYRREVSGGVPDPFAVFNPFYTGRPPVTCRSSGSSSPAPRRKRARRWDEALTAVGLRPEDVLGRSRTSSRVASASASTWPARCCSIRGCC